jgi:hypothetical protein
MLHTEEFVGIILRVPQTHKAKALANPAQPYSALLHELERYIEAHNPELTDINVVSATDTVRPTRAISRCATGITSRTKPETPPAE